MRITAALLSCALPLFASCVSHSVHRHSGSDSAQQARAAISHDVFFTFADPTNDDVTGLITACERLRELPGVVHLTTGRRDPLQTREINETSFDVALHVEFVNQSAYDSYGPHPTHQALVAEFVPKMSSVLVYDSLLRRPGPTRASR